MNKKLTTVPSAPKGASLMVAEVSPVFAGKGPDDFLCGSCGAVLLKGVYPDQIQKLYIKCPCGAVNLSPEVS
jgi:hypothetical protein